MVSLVGLGLSALVVGCHRASGPAPSGSDGRVSTSGGESGSAARQSAPEHTDPGVALTSEEVDKLGVLTAEAHTISHDRAVAGFAVVMPHEPLAQALSEIATAAAASRQSRSALERGQRLAGTPGAMPAEVQEAAARQAAADEAALNLARQRLSAQLGQGAGESSSEARELAVLASGRDKLVRVTFPLGSLANDSPVRLRLARIDVSRPTGEWVVKSIWQAPSDATVPGRSFFAVLKGTPAAEGEHLLAWAETGVPESGVLIPASAVVLSSGRSWCYVENSPGSYVRREIDTGTPSEQGYFVTAGVKAGERIVVKSAALLLSRETNPSTEAE